MSSPRSRKAGCLENATLGIILVAIAVPLGLAGYFYNRFMVHPVFSSSTFPDHGTGRSLEWRALKLSPFPQEMAKSPVRIAGYATAVWLGEEDFHRFLLLPFLLDDPGESPPPTNQIILIENRSGETVAVGGDTPLWVTGRLSVHRTNNRYGGADYSLVASQIGPYPEGGLNSESASKEE
jgi:hypothetical protein